MNNAFKTALGVTAFALLLMAGSIDGPSDTQAAEDVASELTGAPLMADQAARCEHLYGADVQVFVMDGQHVVCRPANVARAVK
jgi:hypothetical protein